MGRVDLLRDFRPFWGMTEDLPIWIQRLEARGWKVSDKIKVEQECHRGWICRKSGTIVNRDLEHVIGAH